MKTFWGDVNVVSILGNIEKTVNFESLRQEPPPYCLSIHLVITKIRLEGDDDMYLSDQPEMTCSTLAVTRKTFPLSQVTSRSKYTHLTYVFL